MIHAAIILLIILAGLWGLCKGFREGLTGQIPGVLGFAFGAVAAHAFAPEVEAVLCSWMPGVASRPGGLYFFSLVSAGGIFCLVYLLCSIFTGILRSAMSVFEVGILDSLFGAAFGLLKNLVFLSLLFNLIAALYPGSSLVADCRADDGNLTGVVMALGPEITGSLSLGEFLYLLQLQEARKISLLAPEAPAAGTLFAEAQPTAALQC